MQQETIIDALHREVKEETGQTVLDVKFVASFYSKDHYSIALCFCAKLDVLDNITFNSEEISDVRLFEMNNLPDPISPRYVFWLKIYQEIKHITHHPQNLFQYE